MAANKVAPGFIVAILVAGLVLAACSGPAAMTSSKTTAVSTTVAGPALPVGHKVPKTRTTCLACHSEGNAKAPRIPASHASYSEANDAAQCLGCHK